MELGNYCGVGWEPNRIEFRVEWADAACCGVNLAFAGVRVG
jgi:hypothetical protein